MRILVWNAQWARGERARRTCELVVAARADVVVLTEGFSDLLPAGHAVESEPDYGYPMKEGRRKVIVWSAHPIDDIDVVGDPGLPTGRFASCVVAAPGGPVRVVGVCVPWRDAHVSTGRHDRGPWEDHQNYLRGLRGVLDSWGGDERLVLAGDFNQRIPRVRQPLPIAEALAACVGDLHIVTSADGTGTALVDHVAVSSSLRAERVEVVSGIASRLSDHDGVLVELSAV